MSTDQTTFPSITFPATFEGTAAIGADFSATLKLKTTDGPRVLEDLKALPRGTYDVTIVSRQGALAGDSLDREWSSMELRADEEAELEYAATCIGGQCPHFAVATSGELEGAYVCQLDPEAPVKIVHGETACPLYPAAEPEGNADDDGVEHLDFEPDAPSSDEEDESAEPCIVAVFPSIEEPDGEYPVATDVGEHTTYGELAADYLAWAQLGDLELRDLAVTDEGGEPRKLRDVIHPDDFGKRLHVVVLEQSDDLAQCTVCRGDGRQTDKSGGGHHGTCEECGGFGCVDRLPEESGEGDAA